MVRVAQIMSQSVLTLSRETSLEEAARTLGDIGVSGAPVCDEHGRVVGVFSKSDAMSTLSEDSWGITRVVGDVMTASVCFARPDDTVRSAIDTMVSQSVHRLIVVGESQELVGIVTPMDVLRALSDGTLRLHET